MLQAALERLMTTWSETVCATARLWNTSGISEFLIEQEGDKLEPVSTFAELLDRPQGLVLSQQILVSLQTGIDLAEAHLQVLSCPPAGSSQHKFHCCHYAISVL